MASIMLPITAALAVLYNADLLDIILLHLHRSDIQNTRLSCRSIEEIASGHLFRTLILSSRKRHFRRLRRVAAEYKFARGVRDIVLEIAHYCRHERFYREEHMSDLAQLNGLQLDPDPSMSEKQTGVYKARLRCLRLDEKSLTTAEGNPISQWSVPLWALIGLHKVTVTSFHEGREGVRRFSDQ